MGFNILLELQEVALVRSRCAVKDLDLHHVHRRSSPSPLFLGAIHLDINLLVLVDVVDPDSALSLAADVAIGGGTTLLGGWRLLFPSESCIVRMMVLLESSLGRLCRDKVLEEHVDGQTAKEH